MSKVITDEKEGWNSSGMMQKEHYFLNGKSLCGKHRYKCRLYYDKGLKIEDMEEKERYAYCKSCNRILRGMLVTKRLDQFG